MVATATRVNRILVLPLALAALLAGATACGGTPGATPTTAAVSGTPATSAPPTTPANTAPTYPTAPRPYAEAVLAAWGQNDLNRLKDLTTTQVYGQITAIPGPPNQSWTFRDCEDDATVYCGFYNAVGDWTSIRIDKDKFGKAHAASDLVFDPTVYPDDAVDYVKAFVLAWQFGNKSRMLQLSKPVVVNQLAIGSPPDGENYPAPTCCGGGLVQVVVNWGGSSVTFDVGSTLLGTPHAIVGYTP